MLTKDPANRITIEQMRVSDFEQAKSTNHVDTDPSLAISPCHNDPQSHPWVTKNGTDPLISVDENCQLVTEVTEEEIHNAIKSVASIFTVVGTCAREIPFNTFL